MECLDENGLLDFLAGRLDGPATSRAREHVTRCAACRAVAAEVIQSAAAHVRATPPRVKSYELVAGGIVADRYRLVRPLGEGGMGVVWEAERLGGGPPARVAIKLLKAFDGTSKKRFFREIAAASRLHHPGVVAVVDVLDDVEAGAPALVMELLEGEPLSIRLARVGALDPRSALAIGRDLASVLAAVHASGLVHRDVKPSNVQLLPDRTRPLVLLDLGLAKSTLDGTSATTRITRTGHVVGTPSYMAPEQLAGERDVDHRADLWSLGAVLHECLTGRRPFHGATPPDLLRAIARGPRPEMLHVAPEVRTVVEMLLAPDREARPATARAVVDLIAPLLARG